MQHLYKSYLFVSFLSLTATTAPAAVIASFDAGDTNATQVQAGFTAIGAAGSTPAAYSGPQTAVSGAVTLRLTVGTTVDGAGNFDSTAQLVARDRLAPGADNGSFTYSDIYRDFVTATTLGIQLSGLSVSSLYAVTFYAYDNNGSRTQTFTDLTAGSFGLSGTVVYTAGSIFNGTTSNQVFTTTLNARSDSSGRLFFSDTGVGSGGASNVGILNGVVVDAIPEPSASILLGLAAFTASRRRQKSRR